MPPASEPSLEEPLRAHDDLERELAALRFVDPPAGLCDEVVARVRGRRALGLQPRQWLALVASLGTWALVVHALVSWSTAQLGNA